MGWKLVLELAESAQNSRMTSLLVNRHPDGFFTASWAGKDCGELLLDDSNYSASSSPQPKRLSSSKGMESIFTFGRASQQPISDIAVFERRVRRGFESLRGMFSESEEKLLKKCALGRICTIDAHGYPHCVRVDFLYRGGLVYVGSKVPRLWHGHISENPKVAFEIDVYERGDDGLFDFRGLMLKGEAYRVAKSEERRKAVKLLQDRHPGAPFGDNPIVVRIIPRKRYRWGPWNKIA